MEVVYLRNEASIEDTKHQRFTWKFTNYLVIFNIHKMLSAKDFFVANQL